jgi:hypothetical protein
MYKQGIEISSNKIVPATGTGYKSNSCQTNFNFVPPDSAIGDRSRDVSFVCPPTGCQYYQDNSCPVGHPCKPASGAKVFTEVDFDPPDAALHFTRFYNSNGSYRPQNSTVVSPGLLGDFWRTNYDRTLFPISGSMYVSVAARRPDGTVKYFNSAGVEVGHFNGRAADILAPISGGGWTLTRGDDEIETYNGQGQLISLWDKTRLLRTLAYDGAGGFYPDFADTSAKAHYGPTGGVSCNERDTAKNSSVRPWA